MGLKEVVIAKSKVPSKKPKKLKAKGVNFRRKLPEIVIDQQAGLVFDSEKELYEYFQKQIEYLEKQLQAHRKEDDLQEDQIPDLSAELDLTLDEPAEIWYDEKTFSEFPIFYFIRPFDDSDGVHVAVTYVSSEDEPTFIFLHFVTRDLDLVSLYRRGDLVYDRAFEEVGFGALEGDSLAEGDPMAIGLFLSMLKLRSENDVAFDQFQTLGAECREETIENADEIWRSNDLQGNTLVTFIRDFPDHLLKDLSYIAVTQEDTGSAVHSLLFSFPTTDSSLVDRYRHGENLQTDDVSQESSH
jgi:hypothetical protein